MSNLDNIIEEILQVADKEAKDIIKNAELESNNLIEKVKIEAQKNADKIIEKAKFEATQTKDRIVSNSNLVARDNVLVAKQGMIDTIFEMAKEKLKDIDHESYLKFVENSLKNLQVKDNSEIMLTEKEKNLTDGTLFGIKVSEETVQSGFSLKNDKILFNNEFGTIIDILKEDLEQEVVNKLFS